jgi:NADPH-dependent 2,4-dienoyl-CoA reductase/sulfur reductase-like enzyme/rhodanese-related sulfurtransferase
MRILIVGGVAGGASVAARARRLSETAEIILVERGPHVSFANCGLPYHVGGEIPERSELLLHTPETLHARFNLDVRVQTEAVAIQRVDRTLAIRDHHSGQETLEPYDALILSTGAAPLKPPIPGIDRAGHFTVRNVPDIDQIQSWIRDVEAKKAVVVGGGYVGLEMAEQLRHRGLQVAVVEALPQVMAPLDPEMAAWLHSELEANQVRLLLNDPVAGFEAPSDRELAKASTVVLQSGQRIPADLVILGLGVRPDVDLARVAGLELGALGGIRVNDRLQTNDPSIYAVGDAIEVRDAVTGSWTLVPLAGPANRQGRIVADNLLGEPDTYAHTWGTAALRLFSLTAACVGANEKTLRKVGREYQVLHLHPPSHAGYYPGASPIALKILFDPESNRLLGAQAVGKDGVDKRIDVLATALQAGLTLDQIAQLELAYAPPIGSAKDPVNLVGMAAQNVKRGLVSLAQWSELASLDPAQTVLLDVRSTGEWQKGGIPGSIHIPLPELRQRVGELPRDKEIVVHCQSGQRSYFACRFLSQNGYRTRNLTGSYRTWKTATQSSPSDGSG